MIESLTEYFARTASYWLERAAVGFSGEGKVLRRRAFTMANYHFMDRRVEIELLEHTLQGQEIGDDHLVETRNNRR